MNRIDLHTHSTASDGTLSPHDLVRHAKEIGLAAIALTDHDTISGIPEAISAGIQYKIEVVPGIELAATYMEQEIHILGLDIDHTSQTLVHTLQKIQSSRAQRNLLMIQKLNELDFAVTLEDLVATAGEDIITRAHYAKLLLEKGYIKTMEEAFQKYLSPGHPAYVHREIFSPRQCIEFVLESGGIPILAHPTLYGLDYSGIEKLVAELKLFGLQGIEAIYSLYTNHQEAQMRTLAHKYQLRISGGSDFHGTNKKDIALGKGRGNLKIPYEILSHLRNQKTPSV